MSDKIKVPYLVCGGGLYEMEVSSIFVQVLFVFEGTIWSAQIESAAKDVERAFEILKGRFRCLKILFHKHVG